MWRQMRVRLTDDQVKQMDVLECHYRETTHSKTFNKMLQKCYDDFKNNL